MAAVAPAPLQLALVARSLVPDDAEAEPGGSGTLVASCLKYFVMALLGVPAASAAPPVRFIAKRRELDSTSCWKLSSASCHRSLISSTTCQGANGTR